MPRVHRSHSPQLTATDQTTRSPSSSGDAVDATSTLAHRDDAAHLLVPEHERRVRAAFAAHGAHVGGADGGELDLDERLAR